jgi:hypothetical protein
LKTPLTDNSTNHDTSNGGSTINYSTLAVRTTIINAIVDFAIRNPGASGINLDYIRTDGVVTGQTDANVTSFVSELRTATAGLNKKINVCALSVYNFTSKHQDIPTWLNNNYIDDVMVMAYYENAAAKMKYWDGCNFNGHDLLVGIGTEIASNVPDFNCTTPSDMRATLRQYHNLGYNNFALFCWGDSMDLSTNQAALNEYLAGTIDSTAPYPAISSVQVVPGTSFTTIIGGTTSTRTYASVSSYVTTGTLKAYIESAEGQRPWIHYQRPTSTTIAIQVGDWEV